MHQGRNSPPPPYSEKRQSFNSDDGSLCYSESSSTKNDDHNMFYYHQQHPCGLTPHQDPTNPFAFTPGQLERLVEKRDVKLLSMLGGVEGVARGLHSHIIHGLSPEHEKYQLRPVSLYNVARMAMNDDVRSQKSDQDNEDDIEDDMMGYNLQSNVSEQKQGPFFQRLAVYGSNVLPRVQHKSLMTLMWEAMQDKTLVNIIYNPKEDDLYHFIIDSPYNISCCFTISGDI